MLRRNTASPWNGNNHGRFALDGSVQACERQAMARIAVIIVNYNTWELTLAGAESVLARGHGAHEVSLHIVDNNSPGGDGAKIAEEIAARGWQDKLDFLPETENHGFGRGNNLVLRALAAQSPAPDYVFLLNPDAKLENEAVAILADFLDANPEVGMVGASIRLPSSEEPVTASFRFPGIASTFESAACFGPVTRLLEHKAARLPPDAPAGPVDWVAGAAVMARFEAWAALEFFDPEFFLYYEEVDLMLRAARAGWGCWYVPQARVIHAEGAATGVKSGAETRARRKPAYWYASWRHYFVKNHGRAYTLALALAWIVAAGLNALVSPILRRPPVAPQHFLRDFWSMAIRPLLGLSERRY